MRNFTLNETLPDYELTANNFAEEAENKIHNSDVAPRFGFKGGLVPGVGDHAYMTRPVVQALGRTWLEEGTIRRIEPHIPWRHVPGEPEDPEIVVETERLTP